METLKQIAKLPMGGYYQDVREPKRIAEQSNSDCIHIKKIANQEYPKQCDIVRGNHIRNSLISYARLNLSGK
jgi:hypothetical protein